MTSLAPRTHPLVRTLLDDPAAVRALLADHGSPLHVVLPEVLAGNAAALRSALEPVAHRIWFAHKANSSGALVAAARAAGLGVDVASPGEWAGARRAGYPAGDVLVTGPKAGAFLADVVRAGAVVNVDNVGELAQVARLARDARVRARVLVRLARPAGRPGGPGRVSRFGVPPQQYDEALALLVEHRDVLDCLGPAFHVDSGAAADRTAALADAVDVVERMLDAGLAPSVVDAGGGLRQVFLDDPAGYERFLVALKAGALGRGPAMGWDGDLFGLRVEGGAVVGTPVVHRFGNAEPAADGLRALLAAPLPGHGGRSAAAVLADNLLELWIEPGKALADQAGLTLATVQFVTTAADGNRLVHVDLSRDKVCPADQEVLTDPVLVGADGRGAGGFDGFVAGNTCLERDLVCRHRVTLPREPRPGDVVAFVNTAAYGQDLSASRALQHRPPGRVAVRSGPGGPVVVPDAASRQDRGQEAP